MAQIEREKIHEALTKGVENVYPTKKALGELLESGKIIKIYHGIDPTGPTLHLGHLVQLLKLKQFQDLGHEIIVLIGDFTAQIGDPTDKTAVRKQLTHGQVIENCKGYKKQIGEILDLKKVTFKYNSKWLAKLNFADILEISSYFTAQQTLARGMFKTRMEQGKDLYLHEFLYPMMQAYDSVFMEVDLEIGGSDQMFNMLAGRTLMKKMKNKEKYVITTKLLEDAIGKKMGKTEGNMVALSDEPNEMFGKVMSWPDQLISLGFEIATAMPMEEVNEINQQVKDHSINPRDLKLKLAGEIVKLCHSDERAAAAQENFITTFQKKEAPDNIEEVTVGGRKIKALDLFYKAGLIESNSEGKRLIKQRGLSVDEVVVEDINQEFEILKRGIILKKGKRHFKKVFAK